ncbi:hypothetical protein STAN_3655 [Streptomyces sp. CBMAI 2042]|nr:hypothetical protein STAN_3655 [Streptomyces sp. CBMAI 2042]
MLIPGPRAGHERRDTGRSGRRVRQGRRHGGGLGLRNGRGRLGHLLHKPMPQEPHSGPHPIPRQSTAQHPPKLPGGHPTPQPLNGQPDELASFRNPKPQLPIGVPQGQQHPLSLSLLSRELHHLPSHGPAFASGLALASGLAFARGFGGWAG